MLSTQETPFLNPDFSRAQKYLAQAVYVTEYDMNEQTQDKGDSILSKNLQKVSSDT